MTSRELLNICHLIWDGSCRVTQQDFRDALSRSILASAQYADENYIPFRDNPLGYLTTRNPSAQSPELIKLIIEKSTFTHQL